MERYYSDVLAADRLRACYDVAPKRTRQYLEAELAHVLEKISPGRMVVELGCGYGRVLGRLCEKAACCVGIDTSIASIRLAKEDLIEVQNARLSVMNAVATGLRSGAFDLTLCIQNGISAFHVDRKALFQEAIRITRPNGLVMFSTYAKAFWPHRLEWFEAQARHHLIGPIDYGATGDGVIVCKDGFQAATLDEPGFRALASAVSQVPSIVEIDGSSLFCEMIVTKSEE